MAIIKSHEAGTFCYAELASADPIASGRFYTELLGWQQNDEDMGELGIYTQFTLDGAVVSAQYQLPSDQQQAGSPSFWGQYISVEDCDASTAKAQALGGETVAGPMDVMDLGRMTILKDPQGAVFQLWQAGKNCGVGILDAPGAMVWNELMTSDTDGAGKFYTNLFGWGTEVKDMGEMGSYTMWTRGEARPGGGMMTIPPGKEMIPPHWLVYFAVTDPDAIAQKSVALGGKVIVPPTDIPNAGRFAVVQDPVGAVFGIFTYAK